MTYFATGAALTSALNALPAGVVGSYKAFDAFWYANQYMGSYAGTLSPIEHFVQVGAARGYKPNADFDPVYYQSKYPDLAGLDSADLLFHYVKFGLSEGRPGNATLGSVNWTNYLAAYPDVAAYVNANLASFGGSATNGAIAHYVKFGASQGFVAPGVVTGQTFTLTTGVDGFTGTSANDIFNATDTTFTSQDSLNGGAGVDTLNMTSTPAITAAFPLAASISGIENLNYTSGGNITLDTTSIAGVQTVKATAASTTGTSVTASATTDVTVTESSLRASGTGQLIVNGGKAVTVAATGTVTQATALTATDGTNAEILIGATAAVKGPVVVTSTFKGADTERSGDIFVKGGTTVTITEGTTNTTVNQTNIQGAVSVVGTADTTTVTVNQDKAATASATGTGVVGKTNGAVTITDVNNGSATAAGVLTSVTLNSFAAATVNSGALTTLNLAGTGTSAAVTMGSLTTPTVTALALNVNGLTTTGAVTTPTVKTLNVTSTGTASTIASLVAADATTINVAGDAKVTFSDSTLGAVTAIVVTNTAGAAFGTSTGGGTALAAGITFTGGAGADTVVLSTGYTKAITMGAGNDIVTYGGPAGTGGSISGGDGVDTIIMTTAQAATAAANSTFNSKVTGFETLRISDALANATDLDGINQVTTVILAAGSNNSSLSNVANGGTVQLNADSTTGLTIGVRGALGGAADSVTLGLSKSGGVLAAGTVTIANVETVNINTADAATAGSAAVLHTATLVATSATTVTVAGNNGLTLTNTGNTAITTFDASGVVANNTVAGAGVAATTDTATNLAVTFVSANTSTTAAVTIKGGAGDDTLTGGSTLDTIIGGAGADTITGGVGVDTLTGGAGADTFKFLATTLNGIDVITDFQKASSGTSDVISLSLTQYKGTTGTTGYFSALKDGNSAAVSAADAMTVKNISAATTLAAADRVQVLTGATFANAAAVQTAIEAGGSRALTFASATTANDDIIVVWSDGTDTHVSAVNIGSAATTITSGQATLTDIVVLTGITSIASGDFTAANFAIVA